MPVWCDRHGNTGSRAGTNGCVQLNALYWAGPLCCGPSDRSATNTSP